MRDDSIPCTYFENSWWTIKWDPFRLSFCALLFGPTREEARKVFGDAGRVASGLGPQAPVVWFGDDAELMTFAELEEAIKQPLGDTPLKLHLKEWYGRSVGPSRKATIRLIQQIRRLDSLFTRIGDTTPYGAWLELRRRVPENGRWKKVRSWVRGRGRRVINEREAGVSDVSVRRIWTASFFALVALGLIAAPTLFRLGSGEKDVSVVLGFVALAGSLAVTGIALADLLGGVAWPFFAAVTLALLSLTAAAYNVAGWFGSAFLVALTIGLAIISLGVASLTGLIVTHNWSVGITLALVSATVLAYVASHAVAWTVLFGIPAVFAICTTGYSLSARWVRWREFGEPRPIRAPKVGEQTARERLGYAIGTAEVIIGLAVIALHFMSA